MQIFPVQGIPEVQAGDDVAALLAEAAPLQDGDILVVTHKIVSKAEGRLIDLSTVTPSDFARRFAEAWNKDARAVELVLRESRSILRMERGSLICETLHGQVCANAGLDLSNAGEGKACLLPLDPDKSARRLHKRLGVPIIISDSFGRPWRIGIVNVAIGVAGMGSFTDYRGQDDPHGFPLKVSVMATADALASAAELVMGKIAGVPAAVIRGFDPPPGNGSGAALVRERRGWFFR
ncbi:MAG: coenzyme F420-0:L-glutamate ligase [Armatimonadetes bacterium]|nr:coenzyme F420-0:L-glutamate ligase [Armatimonadota bacterium]